MTTKFKMLPFFFLCHLSACVADDGNSLFQPRNVDLEKNCGLVAIYLACRANGDQVSYSEINTFMGSISDEGISIRQIMKFLQHKNISACVARISLAELSHLEKASIIYRAVAPTASLPSVDISRRGHFMVSFPNKEKLWFLDGYSYPSCLTIDGIEKYNEQNIVTILIHPSLMVLSRLFLLPVIEIIFGIACIISMVVIYIMQKHASSHSS